MIALLSFGLSHASGFAALGLFSALAVFGACVTAPAQSVELGSALGTCPVGPRCPAMPEPRDWKLVDRIDPARGARPDGQVTSNWNDIPAMDARGRYAHVRSILIQGRARFTVAQANDPVTPYQLRSLINEINFSDAGRHYYFASLDGRTLIDDYWLRHYALPYPLEGGIPMNVGPGVFDAPIDLEIALVSRAPGASPIEGLILVSAIQQTNGSQGFLFRLRTAILGNPGAPAGLALTGFVRGDDQPGLDVWADVVYLDNPVIDTAWSLREYTIAESNSNLFRPEEKTEYAAVRYFPEDAPGNLGQQLAAGINEITLQCASMNFGETRAQDMIRREIEVARSAPQSAAQLGLPLLAQPVEPGVTRPMLMLLPCRARESAPAGPVIYKYGQKAAGATFFRYIHRTAACDTTDRAGRILASTLCGPASCVQPGANALGITDPTAPKIVLPMNAPKP